MSEIKTGLDVVIPQDAIQGSVCGRVNPTSPNLDPLRRRWAASPMSLQATSGGIAMNRSLLGPCPVPLRRAFAMLGRSVCIAGLLLATLGLLTMGAPVHASDYPERPVQLVIPFPPGGSIDVLGRLLSRELSARLGQPVVVENKAGAGTAIGAQHVARAKPDGYTLLLSSNSTFTLNPAVVEKPTYDPVEAFEPVAMVANVALVLLVNNEVPARNLGELVSLAKATPNRYAYGSFGNGTVAHFAGEMFNAAAGTQLMHVPYRGSAMAMTDLMG